MELHSDDVVQRLLGLLHEASEVDRPDAFPEPSVFRGTEPARRRGTRRHRAANMPRQRACAPRLNARRFDCHDRSASQLHDLAAH